MSDHLTVLVVDDAREQAQMVVDLIRTAGAWPGAEFRMAATYDDALRTLRAERCDVAFFDYLLGGRDGLSLLREVRRLGIETPVVVLTGYGAEETAVEAMKAGAADYLNKSNLTIEAIDRAMHHALALGRTEHERRTAEAALRASEERFRMLVENSSDALLLLDADGRVVYMTPSSYRHVGWQPHEMVGRSILEFAHPDDRDVVAARMEDALLRPGVPIASENRFRHADGTWRIMESVGVNRLAEPSVHAIVVNLRDITERRRLADQLRLSQKLEAIGQLAGGVAHDFNNLLTAILGYCNLILEDVGDNADLRRDLEEIRSAGERAAALTRQLLAFSRRQMLMPQTVDINELVRHSEKMMRRLIGEHIELAIALAPDLLPVFVDPASIEQVLLNLALNGRDAMPRGGRLTIQTANIELDAAYASAHVPITPGRYVMLAVGDTGEGMDQETRSRVFEPFFTTREQGRGSGLGLATVYGIVKQSGGFIWVYSEPGQGAVFKVYLAPADVRVDARPIGTPERPVQRSWETVLLVEDEEAVRALAGEVLRRQGYAVLEARHGLDALRIAERHTDDIHLMITDVVMPHMSGRDLAERLSVSRPNMKVLFISGYTDQTLVPHDLTPGDAFLQKPFAPDVFARTVRSVLDNARTS